MLFRSRLAHRLGTAARDAFARGDWEPAARGFREALQVDPGAPEADELRLMIAVIHVRRLPDPQRATEALDGIGSRLPEKLRPLVDQLRAELAG